MSFFDNGPIMTDAKAADFTAPIPEGIFVLNIIKCEEKASKAGDPMLSITWEVDNNHSDYGGRKLFSNILLTHAKPNVAAMGRAQLHSLLLMAGMESISDANDLTGRTVTANVKVITRKDTGELQNEVVLKKPDSPVVAGEPQKFSPTQPAEGSW